MSKTKEEILGQPAYSHECGSFIEVDTRQEVLKAMEAYAAQQVEEYKVKAEQEFIVSTPGMESGEQEELIELLRCAAEALDLEGGNEQMVSELRRYLNAHHNLIPPPSQAESDYPYAEVGNVIDFWDQLDPDLVGDMEESCSDFYEAMMALRKALPNDK